MSSHHSPYVLGNTDATMDITKRCQIARWSQSHKNILSWDNSLKLDCLNAELLVIVNQLVTVNTFSGLVHTACQIMGAGLT
jgi:hypothetical protein